MGYVIKPGDTLKESVGFKPSTDLNAKETTKDSATNDWLGLGTHQWDKTEIAEKLLNDYLGREKFNYDFNGDALYQQYKDKYIQQGKMAMQDTMGQAAAMTGGYGNSYASTAGNQAYQAHLNNLNDVIPELYQMAYDRYNQEGQDMLNQYSLLMNDYELSHKNWEDQYNTLKDKASYADSDYWSNYSKENNEYWKETEFSYGQERDAISDASTKAWAMIQAGVVPSDDILGVAGISKEEAQKVANVYNKAYDGGSDEQGNPGGGDNPINNGGGDGDVPMSGDITDDIKKKAASFTSNVALGSWIDGLEASGKLSPEAADQLFAEYRDADEKFIKGEDGKDTETYSYTDMVGSSKGWTVLKNGGGNFVGIDANASVRAPSGEEMTLKNLKKKLIEEGMSSSKATQAIKKLQQNLDISSNWFFGL